MDRNASLRIRLPNYRVIVKAQDPGFANLIVWRIAEPYGVTISALIKVLACDLKGEQFVSVLLDLMPDVLQRICRKDRRAGDCAVSDPLTGICSLPVSAERA